MTLVSGSILSANDMKDSIASYNQTNVDFLHLDIMDGTFTEKKEDPFLKVATGLLKNKKPLDIHLMSLIPRKLVDKYSKLKPTYLTIHLESDINLGDEIRYIKGLNINAGIAIAPESLVEDVRAYLKMVSMVLLMGVVPGEGGQEMLPLTIDRIKELKKIIKEEDTRVLIAVDGGINKENAELLKKSGADILVSGSYITDNFYYQTAIDNLK